MKKRKKPAPKKAPRKRAPVRSKHEIVVRVEQPRQAAPLVVAPSAGELAAPIESGGKYMIPKTWLVEKQIIQIVQRTPPEHVYRRPAKGGGTWSYVTGQYVEKVLNFVFGWNWDFEVVSHGKEGDLVWVLGKLTVKSPKGEAITKTQFGRAEMKFKRGSKEALDFGNDLKAAATDALKKCASMLGIASDIYGKTDYQRETGNEPREAAPPALPPARPADKPVGAPAMKPGEVVGPQGQPVAICADCSEIVDEVVRNFSVKVYGKSLCRVHQKDHKPKPR